MISSNWQKFNWVPATTADCVVDVFVLRFVGGSDGFGTTGRSDGTIDGTELLAGLLKLKLEFILKLKGTRFISWKLF